MMLVGVSLSVFLLILCSPLSLSHVVTEFREDNCLSFFLDGTTPVIPDVLHTSSNNQEQNRYKLICQKLKDSNPYTFATLYDTENKIPVFSAYTYKGSYESQKRIWMYEPQLDGEQSAIMKRINKGDIKNHQATYDDYLNEAANSSDHKVSRGHIFPMQHAHDKDSSLSTCTLTNIVPQKTTFNGGSWCAMEKKVKYIMDKHCKCNLAEPMAYVVTGAVPGENTIKNRVNIPDFMWTAFCCEYELGKWGSMAHWAKNEEEIILKDQNKKIILPITLDNLHTELKNHYHSTETNVFLKFEAPLDAAACLQEGLSLGVVRQVVDEQVICVHTQVQQPCGQHLERGG
ncbi:unnamed protein product [Coregonus sp. 'balchen']|nr:unnamed protein product [Coregonus sp. 'balchen']